MKCLLGMLNIMGSKPMFGLNKPRSCLLGMLNIMGSKLLPFPM